MSLAHSACLPTSGLEREREAATLLAEAVSCSEAGDLAGALTRLAQLEEDWPDRDEPVLLRAQILCRRGAHDRAATAYEEALERNPVRFEALLGLAALLIGRGEAARAQTLLVRCCGAHPERADAWDALGIALLRTGDAAAAESAFAESDRLLPGRVDVVLRRAEAAWTAGRAELELGRLQLVLADDPADVVALTASGLLLDRLGRRDQAADMLEAASALAPDAALPAAALGSVLARAHRSSEAEAALRRAVMLDPAAREPHNDLGAVLMRLHRHAEAEEELRAALALDPGDVQARCNLANAVLALGRQDEAVATARQAIALAPDSPLPWRALANTLPYAPNTTGAELLEALRETSARLPRGRPPAFDRVRDPERRLRVGILSGTLRTHPVGWLTVAAFEALDRREFEIVCLAHRESTDPITRRFRAAAAEWHAVDVLDDSALAEHARRLSLDVLIDLGGYGEAGRMAACARRFAPVQVKWVGMQNHSSGLAEMDWIIADRWEIPRELEPLYSERPLRLRDGYVCYSPPAYAPEVGPLPALANGQVTIGCFNNLAKITPAVIQAWSGILMAIPGARLVLKTHQFGDPLTVARVRTAFVAAGADPRQVEFRGASPHREFLRQYGDIDLVLDPFPYSGGLTTCEALWMGVPTITIPGETFASRHSASHLSNAGLAEFIAGDLAQYAALARCWADDLPRLASLRAGLRAQVGASPLCDVRRFGESLGIALRHAWREWCMKETM